MARRGMRRAIVFWVLLVLMCPAVHAEDPQPTADQKEWIHIIKPAENEEVIAKKPDIQIEFLQLLEMQSLLVLFDGTDVTQLVSISDNGLKFTPFLVLPPGAHTMSISVKDMSGNQLQRTFSFSNRHTRPFREAYTNNEASVTYENVLVEPDSQQNLPDSKIEGNLRSATKLKNDNWEYTFNTNVRYFDQNMAVSAPLQKGITVANWLFSGTYAKESFKLKVNIGDTVVNETQYTVSNLSRRGGIFSAEYGDFQVNAFSVKSEQSFGLNGIGIEGSTSDHILGASGGIKLFDKRLEFKTIYVNGGEPSSSFGISTTMGEKSGEVLGFLLMTDFFQNKMRTEFEADFSRFDPDTSDEFGEENDKAYKLRINGMVNKYNYDLMYEYVGRDYAVVGNQMMQRDKEGFNMNNGFNLGLHNINLMLSYYNDNVRGDDLFPRIVNSQGNLTYSYNGIPNMPVGITYQKSVQDSKDEPSGYVPLELYMDMVSGRVGYMAGPLTLGFQTSYSLMNDKTKTNNDTRNITYTFTPSYSTQYVSLNPAFSLNRANIQKTGVWTDTYTIGADLRSRFLKQRGTFDIGGTYSILKADDDSVDTRNLNLNFRLAYNLGRMFKDFFQPILAIRGTYMKFADNIHSNADKDEFILFLALSTTMPFSF